jgi:hypothetical protein
MYEGDVRDSRCIARIINLAYRFNCAPTQIDAQAMAHATRLRIAFSGAPDAIVRLIAQIGKIVADEAFA